MASQPSALTLAPHKAGALQPGAGKLADYWTLTKPEVNFLILVTTGAGFCLALRSGQPHFPAMLLINTLLGTLLVASGTGTLNQVIEKTFDAQMRRTTRRPVASGRVVAPNALWFGIALSGLGCLYLAVAVNTLASLLALITLLSYLLLYTPLKRKTPLCVVIGALPGAVPPLIGWAGAAGRLSLEAWSLYAILFLWQFPHFMAIAWMYREDYQRAGYLVLPRGKMRGYVMALQSAFPCLLLMPASIFPLQLSDARSWYLDAQAGFTLMFLLCALRLASERSNAAARQLLFASLIYLPLTLLVVLISKF